MNKQEFTRQLRKGLSGLPQDDIEERLAFYSEMIDDRMEDGLSEEEAVSVVGSVDEIAAQVVADIPLTKIARERIKPKRRLRAGEIILLVLGSPIWLSLLLAAFSVILALYAVLWSVIVTLWAVEASLSACTLFGVVSAVALIFGGNGLTAIAMLGAGICCAGLSILLFFGCKAATHGILWLTKKMALGFKYLFIGKKEG